MPPSQPVRCPAGTAPAPDSPTRCTFQRDTKDPHRQSTVAAVASSLVADTFARIPYCTQNASLLHCGCHQEGRRRGSPRPAPDGRWAYRDPTAGIAWFPSRSSARILCSSAYAPTPSVSLLRIEGRTACCLANGSVASPLLPLKRGSRFNLSRGKDADRRSNLLSRIQRQRRRRRFDHLHHTSRQKSRFRSISAIEASLRLATRVAAKLSSRHGDLAPPVASRARRLSTSL